MTEDGGIHDEGGIHKEIHNHYPAPNGSVKIIWAWAGAATAIVILASAAVISVQSRTNERVTEAVTNLSVRVGQLETKIEALERAVERQQ